MISLRFDHPVGSPHGRSRIHHLGFKALKCLGCREFVFSP